MKTMLKIFFFILLVAAGAVSFSEEEFNKFVDEIG